MKKLFTLFVLITLTFSAFAQSPQKMSYQAIIRNTTGGLITNHAVGIKVSILQGSATGPVVYSETYSPVPQTNANGLVTIEIGGGTPVTGTFSSINWEAGPYYLKTETDPAGGTSFTIIGTSQILSVPYALYARTAGDGFRLPYFGVVSSVTPAFRVENNGTGESIRARTASTDKPGIFGEAPNVGIAGYATAMSGINNGVLGSSISTSGTGVTGYALSSLGQTYGVKGLTESPSGIGVYGQASRSVGINYGVYGKTLSADGWGIYGEAPEKGITGIATAEEGRGVTGISNSSTGIGIKAEGGYIGLNAEAKNQSGESYGIYASNRTPAGYAVYGNGLVNGVAGVGRGTTGIVCGIYGLSMSPEGYSGYFDGGKFYISGKTGIGRTDPGYKLDVMGDRIRLQESGTNDWIALRTDGGTNDYLDLSWGGGSLVMQGATTDENIIMNPSINKVGIKTWTPQYDLDVNGNIRVTGSVYYGGTTTSTGTPYNKPDYVFREEYDVLKTEDVELFLEEKSHLPWVTSVEQEKRENGDATDMTRMAFETLESVENIQLQVIEQQKLILNQQKQINELKALVKTLIAKQSVRADN